jgi:serine/threonine-protein kinase
MDDEQNPPGGTAPPSGAPLTRIGGRYVLTELLGRGGMAEVRKGTDERLGRIVAVKRLRTDLASDQTFQARFRREAQSSASLNHPAIVAVYDTGEEHAEDGGGGHPGVAQPYIVMEYVAGRTLRDILREGRKILPERAMEITSGVLSALDYSHRAGIIHRDIKPANVMLTPSGDVKVMDFGIARAVSDASSTMTQTAAVIGTAQYLSPEQARGETVDSRSDVYSTGCLLYELLSGRPPFTGESPVSVAYQHVREEADPPSTLDEELSPEADAIVMKALAKRVEDRYQSAAAMRADIERFLAGKPVVAPVVPADDATTFLPAGTAESTSIFQGSDDEEEKKRRWPLVLLAALVVALLVAAVILGPMLFSGPESEQSVPTLTMMTRAQAERQLEDAGLSLGEVDRAASEEVRRGLILSQDPQPGRSLAAGAPVDIVISTGKPDVTVPNVVGDDRVAARQELEGLGLRVKTVERESDEEAGTVIETDPEPATSVTSGSLVTLFYSDGPSEVPSVIGFPQGRATQILEDAGFTVSVTFDSETPAQRGTVLAQSPEAFTEQPSGSTVVITVSSFEPEPEPEPSPSPSPSESPSETETTPTTPPASPTTPNSPTIGTSP